MVFPKEALYPLEVLEEAFPKKGGGLGEYLAQGNLPLGEVLRLEVGKVGGDALPYLVLAWQAGLPPGWTSLVRITESIYLGDENLWVLFVGVLDTLRGLSSRAERPSGGGRKGKEEREEPKGKKEEKPSKPPKRRGDEVLLQGGLVELRGQIEALQGLLEYTASLYETELAKLKEEVEGLKGQMRLALEEVEVWRKHVRYANDLYTTVEKRALEMEKTLGESLGEMGKRVRTVEELLDRLRKRVDGL